jgi:hypothetical protein
MSTSSLPGGLLQTDGGRDWRFRSFGQREDTDDPIGIVEAVYRPPWFRLRLDRRSRLCCLPSSLAVYIHRCGGTGSADRKV